MLVAVVLVAVVLVAVVLVAVVLAAVPLVAVVLAAVPLVAVVLVAVLRVDHRAGLGRLWVAPGLATGPFQITGGGRRRAGAAM